MFFEHLIITQLVSSLPVFMEPGFTVILSPGTAAYHELVESTSHLLSLFPF